MSVDDKTLERKLLLIRAYPPTEIFQIGAEQGIPFFSRYVNAWEPDLDEAALELGQAINDKQLIDTFKKHPPRDYTFFRGNFYTLEWCLKRRWLCQKNQISNRGNEKKVWESSYSGFNGDGTRGWKLRVKREP